MTDAEIIAQESRMSFQQCWVERIKAIDAANTMRKAGMMRRHRRARKSAHNYLLLARKWLNHGAMPYWKPNDPRAIAARKHTAEIWIMLERHVERMRENNGT